MLLCLAASAIPVSMHHLAPRTNVVTHDRWKTQIEKRFPATRAHPEYHILWHVSLGHYITLNPMCPKMLLKRLSWWRHQMETFSALLALCVGNSPVTDDFPVQGPVTQSFDVSSDLRLNKRLSKQWWGWWVETPSRSSWRHRNDWVKCWPFCSVSSALS